MVLFNGEASGRRGRDAVSCRRNAHSASAHTDSSGRFVLTTFDQNDGAVPATIGFPSSKARVEYEPDPENPRTSPPLYHAEQSLIPESYGDQTKSRFESDDSHRRPGRPRSSIWSARKLKVLANRRGKRSS